MKRTSAKKPTATSKLRLVLPMDHAARLAEEARRQGCSISDLVVAAVRVFCATHANA